jgi:hypothetical protein
VWTLLYVSERGRAGILALGHLKGSEVWLAMGAKG